VDPEQETVEVYSLKQGTYEPVGKWVRGQRVRSELLEGFEIDVDTIFNKPTP